jgi:rubrerythrin
MAVAREVDASRFYLALAAAINKPGLKKLFRKLAEEELEHKARLELEIMKTGRVVDTRNTPTGLIGAKSDYSRLDFEVGFKDILMMGIQKEQASIQLYTDLAERVTDPDSREILLALAVEETSHKGRFQAELTRAFKSK